MIDYNDVYRKVGDLLCEAKDIEWESITEDMPLLQLQLDSLDYVELMLLVSKEFGVTIETEVFANKPDLSLRELCELICKESL